jgi:hypothetical protein
MPKVLVSNEIGFCPECNFISSDKNGSLFIDYLRLALDDVEFVDENIVKEHRDAIEFVVKDFNKNTEVEERNDVAEKHSWLINYHNLFCDKHGSIHKISEDVASFANQDN